MRSDPTPEVALVAITDPSEIGVRIAIVRGRVNQKDFAARLGISAHTNTIGRYERGERIVDARFLQAICKSYPDLNPTWLLTGEGPQLRSDIQKPAAQRRYAVNATSIGSRIREERNRLGFTQTGFAKLAGYAKRSQLHWESGEQKPNAEVLSAWAAAGADVLYITVGARR